MAKNEPFNFTIWIEAVKKNPVFTDGSFVDMVQFISMLDPELYPTKDVLKNNTAKAFALLFKEGCTN